MNPLEAGAILVLLLFLLLGLGVHVGLSLLWVGLAGLALFTSAPPGPNLATALWTATSGWSLAALPLFVWMGEVLYRSRLAQGLFQGLSPLLARLPGGLLHVNVVASALFAAVIGSSAATTATVGRFTLPELLRRGYPRPLALGSLAGAGTLGFLIPPSVIMIVYGVMAEVSVARLFMAGVVPGVVLTLLFMLLLVLLAFRHRRALPQEPPTGLGQALRSLLGVFPILFLILLVLGSIYLGVATPTEAAAIGVAGALLLAALNGELSGRLFWESLQGAVRTTSMIGLILAGAGVLTLAMGFTGIPRALAAWAVEAGITPTLLILFLSLVYIVLGWFLDGISIVVLTISVILPVVKAIGVDPLWFGIYLVIMVELAQITPPVGFNLFVIQSLTGEDLFRIARYALPFMGVLLFMVVLLVLFPGMATWLPRTMTGG
ncbi:MAG: TRAP transporter large permease subunit [Thermus sp.]|uniref:TRAP transporter large permease n=1 Tax=unclassified Thermus TaxID=2619321 RepID=UPI00023895B9|nr:MULTISPECIES: TRAP transporter large permease subunit [unclassified Thermus]AEV16328.1 TRAP dicarboxylate transporter-DctM subunit [Thermus sp. CCB_US3_UF1]MCS6867698.1 TRAP transporter large permease subunit [Thermus sp.]MCS7219379.1 TRAP transporter large permease subunit [Thermus sp.]MCX7849488.1 TRAP transporter large permease subunit [Thermus sp.]MDW8017531.1 TRAP transporter large permease subunit [Thermus sp.]